MNSLVLPFSSKDFILDVGSVKMVLDVFVIEALQWKGSLGRFTVAVSQFTPVLVACWQGIVERVPLSTVVGGIKVVGCVWVPIDLQSSGARHLIGQNTEGDRLVLVAPFASHANVSDSNPSNVGGVKVIFGALPVSVHCKIRYIYLVKPLSLIQCTLVELYHLLLKIDFNHKQFCLPFLVCAVEAPSVTANAHIKVAMRADGESGFILSVDIVEFN